MVDSYPEDVTSEAEEEVAGQAMEGQRKRRTMMEGLRKKA
jgi:hypothetical protein